VTAAENPTFWMIAGPNGPGKTSLYGNTDIEAFDQSVWIINPDALTERLRQVERLGLRAANLEAVIRIEAWLEASIRAHQTVGVETVLSTDKYRWVKSVRQLPWFLEQADHAFIFDNTGARPQQIGLKSDGKISIDHAAPSTLRAAIERFGGRTLR
jgi:predicted ABC-type ATPase